MSKGVGWLRGLVIGVSDLRNNVECMESECNDITDVAYDKVRQAILKLIEVERLLDDARIIEQLGQGGDRLLEMIDREAHRISLGQRKEMFVVRVPNFSGDDQ